MQGSEDKALKTPKGSPSAVRDRLRKRGGPASKWIASAAIMLVLLVAAGLGYRSLGEPGGARGTDPIATATVARGHLTVTVEDKGAIWASKPLEIKCEAEGWNVILEVVEEGTVITEQDVKDGMVLAKLNTAGLEQKEAGQRISVFGTEAAYTQAKEDLDIQKKQNESNIAIAKLNVKFARMELDRYLGSELAEHVLQDGFGAVDLERLAQNEVELILSEVLRSAEGADGVASAEAEAPRLGGTARQELRELGAKVQLAKVELARAGSEWNWSKELAKKDYISRNELVRDRLEAERRQVALDAAEEELRLFKRYTLPKEAELRYSDYAEFQRDLVRVEARAQSELTQATAKLRSTEAQHKLEKERLDKTREMIEKCTIRAPKAGRVVYGSASDPWWRRQSQPVAEGGAVQENQTILRIPDPTDLVARLNIPEENIEKVKVGQPAVMTLEAAPGRLIAGKVSKVKPMASAEHRWLNPDSKVYETEVALEEVPEHFIPGMAARIQIIVAELEDALYVPRQALTTHQGLSFCWVKSPDGPQLRHVQTGYSTTTLVQITEGMRTGEVVYLAAPEGIDEQEVEARAQAIKGTEGAADTGEPEQADDEGEAPQEAETAEEPESAYVTDGQIDWMKIGQELRGLSEEERMKKWGEIVQKLPPDKRKEAEQAARRFREGPRNRPPGAGEGRPEGQQRGQGRRTEAERGPR